MKIFSWRPVVFLLLCTAVTAPATVVAQNSTDLYGGWVIDSWKAPAGQQGAIPQRGLFLFTASGHYSMMFVIGDARPSLPDNPSDAQIAAAYRPFVANSGRYSISGNEIRYEAVVAKDPEYMSQFAPSGGDGNAQTMTFSIKDGMLTLHFGEGGPLQGATAILRRPRAR